MDLGEELGLSKADRLTYGGSHKTRALLFTGVSFKDGKPANFRVENLGSVKKYFVMSINLFSEIVYKVVIDERHLIEDVMKVFEKDTVELPAWDPMGSLIL